MSAIATPMLAPPKAAVAAPIRTPSWIEADRRVGERTPRRLYARMKPLGASAPISGKTENLGECGFFVLVANQGRLTVGQRCEIELIDEDGETRLACMPPDGCYATVVRTEIITSREGRCLGAGLRFDQPLFL